MKRALSFFVLAGAAGCVGQEIDPTLLPTVDDYRTWGAPIVVVGDIPGHPSSHRSIYRNDIARAYPHGGRYPIGSVIVKEVADLGPGDSAGEARYTAIMRKLGDDTGLPTDDGWLFTSRRGDGPETQYDLCWQTCHKAGPRDGTWFDYGE